MVLYIILEGVIDISNDKNSKAVAYRLQSYIKNYNGTHEDVLEGMDHTKQQASLTPLKKLITRKQNA